MTSQHTHMTSLVQKILFDSDRDKFAMTQNARERCCWHSNIWPTGWFTPHQSITKLQRHTEVYEETFDVNIKIAQTTQNSWNFNIVGKSSLLKWRKCKLRRLLGRLRTLILRPRDAVQNLESPGLSGGVVSTDYFYVSWRREPPFYVFIQTTWRSSRLQCKGSTLISQLL